MIRCSLLVQCILYSTTGLQIVSSSLTKCFSKNENEDSPGLNISCSEVGNVLITWNLPNDLLSQSTPVIAYLCYNDTQDTNNVQLYEEISISGSQFSAVTKGKYCVVKGCTKKIAGRGYIYERLKDASCSFSNEFNGENDTISPVITSVPKILKSIVNSAKIQSTTTQQYLTSPLASHMIITNHTIGNDAHFSSEKPQSIISSQIIIQSVITPSIDVTVSKAHESKSQLDIAMVLTLIFIGGLLVIVLLVIFSLTGLWRKRKRSIELKFTDATVCSITILPTSTSDISIKTFVAPLNFIPATQCPYIEHIPSISDTDSVSTIDHTILNSCDECFSTENTPSVFEDSSSGNAIEFTGESPSIIYNSSRMHDVPFCKSTSDSSSRESPSYISDSSRMYNTRFCKSTSDSASSGSYIITDTVSSQSITDTGYITCS